MSITLDNIRHAAKLSNIALTDQEALTLQQDLDKIVSYITLLDQADLAGLEPTYQVTGLNNVMRTDQVIDYNVSTTALLKNAPDQQNQHIKVPKVL